MIEIHTLSQFDHFTLMKQIQQEEHARFAAGKRLHPLHMGSDDLLRKLHFKWFHLGRLRLSRLWSVLGSRNKNALRFTDNPTGIAKNSTHCFQIMLLDTKRHNSCAVRRNLHCADNYSLTPLFERHFRFHFQDICRSGSDADHAVPIRILG
jgi:hypothetical protein